MSTPVFKSFTQLVSGLQAQVASLTSSLVQTGVGTITGALINVIADQTSYLSGKAANILTKTRAATSTGDDMDSYAADLGLTRLPAYPASGLVTFSRFSATMPATIPPGAVVKTVDGAVSFAVVTDTLNPAWNTGLGAYLLPAGTLSASLPVAASTPGSSGNVQAGSISLIVASLAGIDLVTNPLAFSNGVDPETDDALRTRCWQYETTRAEATQAAVEFAISSVAPSISRQIGENVAPDGTLNAGSFLVLVDDGTGSPPSSLLAAISAAVDPVRPLSVRYSVQPCTVIPAAVSMTIYAAPAYNKADLIGPVIQAVEAYVDQLGVGASLAISNINFVAMSVEGVAKVENLLLNGSNSDVGGGFGQSVHIATCVVS